MRATQPDGERYLSLWWASWRPGLRAGVLAAVLAQWYQVRRFDTTLDGRRGREVVVGRKNHYGSRSKRGTEVAALFYTLLETAKLSQVDPAAYLRQAASRAIATPGTVILPSNPT